MSTGEPRPEPETRADLADYVHGEVAAARPVNLDLVKSYASDMLKGPWQEDGATWTTVTAAEDVTDEILAAAQEIHNGWYAEKPIDWQDFLERLEGMELADGTQLDLGGSMGSPAIEKIKKHIRAYRKS